MAGTSAASVFWDFENCAVPSGVAGFLIAKRVKDLCQKRNLELCSFIAMGDTTQLNQAVRADLEESGVSLINVLSSKEVEFLNRTTMPSHVLTDSFLNQSAADIAILTELMKTVYFVKPPHEIILISGDRDFSKALYFLESVKYSVTLIHNNMITDVLRHSVRETIHWFSFLEGTESPKPIQTQQQQATMAALLVLHPKNAERALPLLRAIKRLEAKIAHSSRPVIGSPRISEILKIVAMDGGFRSVKQYVQWAAQCRYVLYDDMTGTVVIQKEGLSILKRFAGVTVKTFSQEAGFVTDVRVFHLLIQTIKDIQPDGENVNKHIFLEKLHLIPTGLYPFKCANDYYAAALHAGVLVRPTGSTVSLSASKEARVAEGPVPAVSSAGYSPFEGLIRIMNDLQPNGQRVLKHALIERIETAEHSFKCANDCYAAALHANVIVRDADNQSVSLVSATAGAPSTTTLSAAIAVTEPRPPISAAAEPRASKPRVPESFHFQNLLAYFRKCKIPRVLLKVLLSTSSELHWKAHGYASLKEFLQGAESLGLVSLEFSSVHKDVIVSAISPVAKLASLVLNGNAAGFIKTSHVSSIYDWKEILEPLDSGQISLVTDMATSVDSSKDDDGVSSGTGAEKVDYDLSETAGFALVSDGTAASPGDTCWPLVAAPSAEFIEQSAERNLPESSDKFSDLIRALRELGQKNQKGQFQLRNSLLGTHCPSQWRVLGYSKFGLYVRAAESAGILSIEHNIALSDTVVTLLSAKMELSANEMFEPLIDAFNHRKSNSLLQSHLGGIGSNFRVQRFGFKKFKDYLNAAVDAGVIRISAYNAATNDTTITLLKKREVPRSGARASQGGWEPREPLHGADVECLKKKVRFSWTQSKAKSVILMGSWNNWGEGLAMTMHEDGYFYGFVQLDSKQEYLFKFIVDGEWLTDPMHRMRESGGNLNNCIQV
ncbi:hypothetical protein CcCBS67573_g03780 [Chytriomyces confervae]|uniref:NYN domain-containing protein n=1 Tax=Chytriomyces confervae TaxID=246404 RepID=A0A507FF11_9FUNG|nr:hypothetical protein CcCBS67573_g03780 [Chytriomyces confervae]